MWLAFLLLAAAAAHAEPMDARYSGSTVLDVDGVALHVDGDTLRRGDEVLARRLLAAPATDGRSVCAADEADDGLGRLRCWTGPAATTLMTGGRPTRLAMAEGHVAWVASVDGLPKVFVAPADGGEAPRPLTNLGLRHAPGGPPAGFVPPPLRGPPRFDGAWLRWDAQDGAHAVRWR